MAKFSTFLVESVNEIVLSPLQKESISSSAELDTGAMKKFFDGVSSGLTKGQGKKISF